MIKFRHMAAAAALATLTAGPVALSAAPAKKEAATPVAVAAPAEGKAQVVFFRPGGMGMAIKCTIRNDGKLIGQVGNGKYFIATLDPGKYAFTTKTEATDTLNMELESNETYYVRCKIGMGMVAGRPNISPATKADFDAKSAKLKLKTAEEVAEDQAEEAAKK